MIRIYIVNGNKIPIVDDDNKDGVIPFVITKGMLSELRKKQEEEDIKMSNLIFNDELGDRNNQGKLKIGHLI